MTEPTDVEVALTMMAHPQLTETEATALLRARTDTPLGMEQTIRIILEANNYEISVAEARAKAEGRPYQTTRDYSSFEQSLNEIRTALLREHEHNVDIGELLVQAVTEADRELRGRGAYLTQNRPGSWEAGRVEQLIQRD